MAENRRQWTTANERRTRVVTGVVTGTLFAIGQGVLLPSFYAGVPVWVAILLGPVMGAAFGSFLAWFIARTWRRTGGLGGAKALRTALRTQTLPSEADREFWTELLDRQEKELSRNTVYVVCIAAAAALYFILGLSGAIPDLGAWVWIGSALLAGIAVFSVFEARSRRARINARRAQLGPDTAVRP